VRQDGLVATLQGRDVFDGARGEIVNQRDLVALQQQSFRQMTADKTRASRNECFHAIGPLSAISYPLSAVSGELV